MESAWAENGDLAHPWQWKPCRLPRVDCSREFCNKVMRSVICWRPLCIGSYFHSSDGAASSSRERCPHFLCCTSVPKCPNRRFGCNGRAERGISGPISCLFYNHIMVSFCSLFF